jgi:enhancing lycopene biosynthesis protein 2
MTGFMQIDAARTLLPEVRALLETVHARRGPIGSISLGRSVVRAFFGEEMSDEDLALPAAEVVVDEEHRTLFTPGFLTAVRLSEAARGIDAMIEALVRMAARGLQVVG